jgi:hypothetical protein
VAGWQSGDGQDGFRRIGHIDVLYFRVSLRDSFVNVGCGRRCRHSCQWMCSELGPLLAFENSYLLALRLQPI